MSVGEVVYWGLARSGLAGLHRRREGGATVFAFHNVVDDALAGTWGERPLHIARQRFTRYLDWITDTLEVVPLRTLADRVRAGRSVRGLAALTFDDAYVGAVRLALPLIRARGLAATMFVVSDASSAPAPFWWDVASLNGPRERDACLTDLGGDRTAILARHPPVHPDPPSPQFLPATWDELRQASGPHVVYGAHSVSHRNLVTLERDELRDELTRSRTRVADELDTAAEEFSYPYGIIGPHSVPEAERAGYRVAVTLAYGPVRPGDAPLALNRVNVPDGITLEKLDCWAAGMRRIGFR